MQSLYGLVPPLVVKETADISNAVLIIKVQSVHIKLDRVNGSKLRFGGQIKNLRRKNHFEKFIKTDRTFVLQKMLYYLCIVCVFWLIFSQGTIIYVIFPLILYSTFFFNITILVNIISIYNSNIFLSPSSCTNDAVPLNSLFWSPPTIVHRLDALRYRFLAYIFLDYSI